MITIPSQAFKTPVGDQDFIYATATPVELSRPPVGDQNFVYATATEIFATKPKFRLPRAQISEALPQVLKNARLTLRMLKSSQEQHMLGFGDPGGRSGGFGSMDGRIVLQGRR